LGGHWGRWCRRLQPTPDPSEEGMASLEVGTKITRQQPSLMGFLLSAIDFLPIRMQGTSSPGDGFAGSRSQNHPSTAQLDGITSTCNCFSAYPDAGTSPPWRGRGWVAENSESKLIVFSAQNLSTSLFFWMQSFKFVDMS